jgi:hypothetical protein
MARLILGPLLRHIGEHDATIWVETDAPCEVEVRAGDAGAGGRERTFAVAGHYYALIPVTGLEPASSVTYEVHIDGDSVWPDPESTFPPSRIRTIDPARPIRLIFGSCREAPPMRNRGGRPPDVLDSFASRMLTQHHEEWPDMLLLVGDQVYADYTTPTMQAFIKSRRDIRRAPYAEVADFEEYTRLYLETWGEPTARWLLSTLPSSMIFDDHDVRDDWNTSHAWRREMQRTDWWDARISGALMSYWIYQHLGNLSLTRLADDTMYATVRKVPDAEPELRTFAQQADREADGAKGTMWSYRRDFGPVRLLVIDSRCGRILADGHRSMVSDPEFEWIEAQVDDGGFEHLVVVTSMPWLLPRALHDIESWNEALAAGSRGRTLATMAEWLRRAVDLEHWAAFRKSFDRLARLFERVGRGEHGGSAPATICVLSGDVHHAYVSEADYEEPLESRVYQITCSPINNTVPLPMRLVFHVGWSHTVERVTRFFGRWTHVPPLPIRWHHPTGPHFGNMLALLTLDGRSANIRLERSIRIDEKAPHAHRVGEDLAITAELSLTDAPRRTP